jgi:hypothetical protein
MKIEAATFTLGKIGVLHAANILKTGEGLTIIDSYNIQTSKTKNVEKVLEVQQKINGLFQFDHSFFEGNEFKYSFITKDGRNLLNFLGYDESLNPLKESLINREDYNSNANNNPDLAVKVSKEDYASSFDLSFPILFGNPFFKIGEIRGDSNSPVDKIYLIQTGLKKKFQLFRILDIDSNINFAYGKISQDYSRNDIINLSGGFSASTKNKEGFNLSANFERNYSSSKLEIPFPEDAILFDNTSFGAGASWKIPLGNLSIEPYLLSQFALFPEKLLSQDYTLNFNELESGARLEVPILNSLRMFFNPYYTRRIWEQEFGANAGIKINKLELTAGGYSSKSNYDFCPDKSGFNIGLSGSINRNISLDLKYKTDRTNYDGEIEDKQSFSMTGKWEIN